MDAEKERFFEKHKDKIMKLLDLVNGMSIYEMKLMFALCEDVTDMIKIDDETMLKAMINVIRGET